MSRRTLFIFCVLCGILLNLPSWSSAQEEKKAIDPQADRILRQMGEYLNTLEQFTIHIDNTVDTLLSSGQKVQLGRAVDLHVRRPDRMRANVDGDQLDQEFFYDGKSVTLFTKNLGFYAAVKAPSNIEDALDHAEQSVGLVAPFSELIYRDCYDILMEDVQSSLYMGLSKIRGVECHHLAFRGKETDWEIWIENSKTPFPRKFVITGKWVAGAPQFAGLLTKWDVSSQLKDSLFTFVPPQGAEKIDFLRPED